MRPLWELSPEELDEAILTMQTFLDLGGYDKKVADQLAALKENKEERLIERKYDGKSPRLAD